MGCPLRTETLVVTIKQQRKSERSKSTVAIVFAETFAVRQRWTMKKLETEMELEWETGNGRQLQNKEMAHGDK